MRKQNFKSDFDFQLDICDHSGQSVGIPEINWEILLFTTSRQLVYKASYQYGECQNCVLDRESDKIMIMVDNHSLPVGELRYELTAEIPDENFPDGSRKVFTEGTTDIEIVNEVGHQIAGAVVKAKVAHLEKHEEESPEPPAEEGGEQADE